jgi:hypothetical protein
MDYPVLSILSKTRVVVAAGTVEGIKVGTRFFMYAIGPEPIGSDGTVYEPVELIRGYGRAIHVQNTISTIESEETMTDYRVISAGYSTFARPESKEVSVVKPFDSIQKGDYARVIKG